jgi:hypothetical protein
MAVWPSYFVITQAQVHLSTRLEPLITVLLYDKTTPDINSPCWSNKRRNNSLVKPQPWPSPQPIYVPSSSFSCVVLYKIKTIQAHDSVAIMAPLHRDGVRDMVEQDCLHDLSC